MIDPIGQIVGAAPEPTLIGYDIAAELALSWAIARPGVLPFYSALYRGATMNSHGSGRPDAECEAFLASLPSNDEGGQILRSYADLIESAHELAACGVLDNGSDASAWIEQQMGVALLYVQHVCRNAGLAEDVENLFCVMFLSILQEKAEDIAAAAALAPASSTRLH